MSEEIDDKIDVFTKKLNEFDHLILYKLVQNGRESLSEISRQIGKSVQYIEYRIKRMEKLKYLSGFVLIVDTSKLGLQTYSLYLTVRETEGDELSKIIAYFKEKSNVSAIEKTVGKYQLYISIHSARINDVEILLREISKLFQKSVTSYRLLNSYKAYSPAHNFLFPDKKMIWHTKEFLCSEKEELSEKARKVLHELNNNPRASFHAIANKIGGELSAVRRIYNDLVKRGVIIHVRPSLNPAKIGYLDKHAKINIKFRGMDQIDNITAYLLEQRETKWLAYTYGDSDLTCNFIFTNLKNFRDFQKKLFREFGDYIRFIDYLDNYEEVKFKYNTEIIG